MNDLIAKAAQSQPILIRPAYNPLIGIEQSGLLRWYRITLWLLMLCEWSRL